MSPVAGEHSFDELTRGMASGSISRGKALKLMGAALLGGTLASLGIREAGADPPGCKRNGKNCTRDKQCCSEKCDSSTGKCAPACLPNSISSTCTADSQCCSGICNTTSSGSCGPCRETGVSCTSASDCCSGHCANGCVPAQGVGLVNFVQCFCNDGAVIQTCSTIDCNTLGASSEFCTTACASHGGRASDTCVLRYSPCGG
jgi:hypothetical protein